MAAHLSWADGFPAKLDVGVAHAELEGIRAANGGELTATAVVEVARDRGNVLHPQVFNLRQKAAAEEYYKERARLLIRAVMVRYDGGPTEPTRVYQVVREGVSTVAPTRRAKVYGDILDAMADPEQRRYVLEAALWEAERWRKKYQVLDELSEVHDAILAAGGAMRGGATLG
jgi:hypothetical protein